MVDNRAHAYQYFLSHGYTPVQAAGIVGGLLGETEHINPTQTHDGGIGYGISGWNHDRLAGLYTYARANGLDPSAVDTQLGYVNNELHTTEGSAGKLLATAQTPQQAGQDMLAYFRPHDWNVPGAHPERARYAGQVYSQFAGAAPVMDAQAQPTPMPQARPVAPPLSGGSPGDLFASAGPTSPGTATTGDLLSPPADRPAPQQVAMASAPPLPPAQNVAAAPPVAPVAGAPAMNPKMMALNAALGGGMPFGGPGAILASALAPLAAPQQQAPQQTEKPFDVGALLGGTHPHLTASLLPVTA